MSTSARRRLLRDFRRLQNDPPSGITGAPLDRFVPYVSAALSFLFFNLHSFFIIFV